MSNLETVKESGLISKEEVQNNVINYFKANSLDSRLSEVQKDHFLQICLLQGFNPLLKEVYAVPLKNNRTGKTDMNIVVAYEQYLKRAEQNHNYEGFSLEYGTYDINTRCYDWIECIVYRSDRKMPTKARALYHEYKQNFGLWNSKPVVMLEKVAISRAFRWAFPTDFKGMPYTSEEMPQAEYIEHKEVSNDKEILNQLEVNEQPKTMQQDLTDETIEGIETITREAIKPIYGTLTEDWQKWTEENVIKFKGEIKTLKQAKDLQKFIYKNLKIK